MAEEEQRHRMHHESEGMQAEIREARRGQILGAAVSGTSLAAALIAVWLGAHPVVSCALVGVPILGMVRAIINARSRRE